MLEAFGHELWVHDGPRVRFLRIFPYPTRMAVVRLRDGGLWIWSPTALEDGLARAVDALGEVRHLVAPNKLHHLELGTWQAAYPGARLHAAPGLARKRSDLVFHDELGDRPDPAWARDIDQVVFRGSLFMDEVVFFHRPSRTVLIADLIQRFDPHTVGGWRGLLMRLDGLVGPGGSTPREWRASFWNRRAARAARDKLVAWRPERLVIAHGSCVSEGASEAIRRGLRWL